MAGLCEGGNEPSGPLKAICNSTSTSKRVEFINDLCCVLTGSDIPLWNSPAFRQFLKKYTTHNILNQSILRKNYSEEVYQETGEDNN
ncbi:hypothetical protein ANN_17719 [Periplaneta americana]|uniref:Uncharacterized protein n=1 Tax=Periplaneta americana TaxID=6978 RepID=A0ABQ8STQ9_PERAM|nr:hypothetical protein ANN_17719 [Periplaneta americana]